VAGGLPETLRAFHWHEEEFSLPEGARPLFASRACACQAFLWQERALGLQLHLEATRNLVETLADHGRARLAAGGAYVQSREALLAEPPASYRASQAALDHLLDVLVAQVAP
jgi:GMP synthase-like glutamine amidotransferase